MFDQLNADGRTIVVITHEHDVAARARRLIRVVGRPDRRRRGDPLMSPRDLFGAAAARAQREQAALRLTVLGILIGVAAVILLVAVGNGSAQGGPGPARGARHQHC